MFADYKQIELRMLAFYMSCAGHPSMTDAVKAGKDLHEETARGVYNLSAFATPTEEQRDVAKVCNFLMVYGGGTPALTKTLDISFPAAKKLLQAFHATWPGIAVVQAQIDMRLETRGYVTTLWGRHLHPESAHKALNALVQGCSADLMKAALVKVQRYLLTREFTSHIVSSVHDEMILDCVEAELLELAYSLPTLMSHPPIAAVIPIGVDIEISRTNWAEKIPYTQENH